MIAGTAAASEALAISPESSRLALPGILQPDSIGEAALEDCDLSLSLSILRRAARASQGEEVMI